MTINRVQYALKSSDKYAERQVFHFETDSKMVLMEDGRTLNEFAQQIDGKRKIVLNGAVTGSVETDGHSDVKIETTVGDDSHKHTGATLDVGTAGRVVVTTSDGVDVSTVTAEELKYLSGVTGNIQDQLDAKSINIDLPSEEDPPTKTHFTTKFRAIDSVNTDENGKLTSLGLAEYMIPRFAQFYNSATEPTDQVTGDFWLKTLSVEIGNGENFIEDLDDQAKTTTVGKKSESVFTMTDLDTDVTEPAAPYEAFSAMEILADLG